MVKTVIATISYDKNELSLRNRILQSFQEWRELKIDIVTSDSRSSKEFIRKAEDMGVVVLKRPDNFVGTGMKQSIEEAAKRGDRIIYTESDKSGKYGFTRDIQTCVSKLEEADLVIPGRTASAFSTYPLFQQWTEENIINVFYRRLLQELADTDVKDCGYGPKAFKKEIAPFFVKSPYIDWAVSYEPLIRMACDGAKRGKKRKITEVKIDVEFPAGKDGGDAQAAAYRVEQGHQIMQPVITYYRTHRPDQFFDVLQQYSSTLQKAGNLARGLISESQKCLK